MSDFNIREQDWAHLCTKQMPCGSRVTCDPPPTDTDEDYLLLCPPDMAGALKLSLCSQGWELGGSTPADEGKIPREGQFFSFTKEHINLIVVVDAAFYDRFALATHVAKRLNLLKKEDRITLFQGILYGNRV